MAYSDKIIQHYAATNQKRFSDLTPETAELFAKLVKESFSKLGVLLSFYSGYRTEAEQWDLRKKYLNGGALAAKPGESWHQYRRAGDAVIITPEGTASWVHPQFKNVVELAKSYGLRWGGSNDTPHFYNDKNTSLWLLKNQSNRWQIYDSFENALNIPVIINDIEPIKRDNIVIIKKVAIYTFIGSLLGYGLYNFIRYVRTS